MKRKKAGSQRAIAIKGRHGVQRKKQVRWLLFDSDVTAKEILNRLKIKRT